MYQALYTSSRSATYTYHLPSLLAHLDPVSTVKSIKYIELNWIVTEFRDNTEDNVDASYRAWYVKVGGATVVSDAQSAGMRSEVSGLRF